MKESKSDSLRIMDYFQETHHSLPTTTHSNPFPSLSQMPPPDRPPNRLYKFLKSLEKRLRIMGIRIVLEVVLPILRVVLSYPLALIVTIIICLGKLPALIVEWMDKRKREDADSAQATDCIDEDPEDENDEDIKSDEAP